MTLASGGIDHPSGSTHDDLLKGADPRTRTTRTWLGAWAATGLVAALALQSPAAENHHAVSRDYAMTALSQQLAATVLTLEPGIVGLQHFYHFTPTELQGYFCAAPNTCRPVDYTTLPGDKFNELGADKLIEAVAALPAGGGPVILMGHSQGAQVIYSALRRWNANPAKAPDPARVSWVSIGNPDNPYGIRPKVGNAQPRPAVTPYAGTEVIRQYDGWADWPDDPTNLLAVFNAIVGMQTVHPNYFNVNVDDPANVRYTPELPDGSPGNVTYLWVPTKVLPMVAGFGPLAPVLDSWLRPTVEAAYHRPVAIPAPGGAPAVASSSPPAAATLSVPVRHRGAPAASARTGHIKSRASERKRGGTQERAKAPRAAASRAGR